MVSVILIGILVALGILIAFIVVTYMGLVTQKALVDEGWSGIDVQLKRRYDLIPNLVATVKGYSIHEKGCLKKWYKHAHKRCRRNRWDNMRQLKMH